jgi:hypothetical protein
MSVNSEVNIYTDTQIGAKFITICVLQIIAIVLFLIIYERKNLGQGLIVLCLFSLVILILSADTNTNIKTQADGNDKETITQFSLAMAIINFLIFLVSFFQII